MKLSEVIAQVIPLANAMSVFYDADLAERFPTSPAVEEEQYDEWGGLPTPEYMKLLGLLSGLSDEDLYRLQLLIDFGYGAFGPDKLARRYEAIKKRLGPSPRWLVEMLAGDETLGLKLADGLDRLEQQGIDIDAMLPVGAAAAVAVD